LSAESFRIAIVGAGPGGLSAASRAAELGVSHVLLEQSAAHANTIQRYQKGKHVMAEPNVLPLRSPLPFAANTSSRNGAPGSTASVSIFVARVKSLGSKVSGVTSNSR
jgi:flavin-dependent dehydrogenase